MNVRPDVEDVPDAFREGQPLAWAFHRNTSRWLHNVFEPDNIAHSPAPPMEHPDAPFVPLVEPEPVPLFDMLAKRRSCRNYGGENVSLRDLATVLAAAYGVTGLSTLGPLEFVERSVPSGGGLYPLELYVIVRAVDGLNPGVYHYVPLQHGLELLRDHKVPDRLVTYLFMGQSYASEAACTIVIGAVTERSLKKYGDRGYRYILFEAGHVAQNINLAGAGIGLGTCNFGGFFDDELAALLGMQHGNEIPLYGIAIGTPASDDPVTQRAFER